MCITKYKSRKYFKKFEDKQLENTRTSCYLICTHVVLESEIKKNECQS
jgi:hypothetical protein